MSSKKSTLGPWQLFISHSSKDKPFVKKLAKDLRESMVSIWLDEWELKPGDSLLGKISEGIEKSYYLAIILSPASVESKWVTVELRAALTEQIHNEIIKVIPILYKDCTIPVFLRDRIYIDFRSKYEDGFKKLAGFIKQTPKNEELRFQSEQLANLFASNGVQVPCELLLNCGSLSNKALKEFSTIALLALRSAKQDDNCDNNKFPKAHYKINNALWNNPLNTIKAISDVFSNTDFSDVAKDRIYDEQALDSLSKKSLLKLVLDETTLNYYRIIAAKQLGKNAILQDAISRLQPIWNAITKYRSIAHVNEGNNDKERLTQIERGLVGITTEWCTDTPGFIPKLSKYYTELDLPSESILTSLLKLNKLGYLELSKQAKKDIPDGTIKITQKGILAAKLWFPHISVDIEKEYATEDEITYNTLLGIKEGIEPYSGVLDEIEWFNSGLVQFITLYLSELMVDANLPNDTKTRIWKSLPKRESHNPKMGRFNIINTRAHLPKILILDEREGKLLTEIHLLFDRKSTINQIYNLIEHESLSSFDSIWSSNSSLTYAFSDDMSRDTCRPLWATLQFIKSIDDFINEKIPTSKDMFRSLWYRLKIGIEDQPLYTRIPKIFEKLIKYDLEILKISTNKRRDLLIQKGKDLINFYNNKIGLTESFLSNANDILNEWEDEISKK